MTTTYKKTYNAQILQETRVNESTYIKKGYILSGFPTIKNRNLLEGDPNVAVGSVYTMGNISRSFINLSNIGTLYGNLSLEDSPEPNLDLVVYNYLNSLIPGQYPPISGKWSETQDYYSLTNILDYLDNNPNKYFCKILGLGLGNINSWRVADVCRNSLSSLSENYVYPTDEIAGGGFITTEQILKQTNWSNILDAYYTPLTTTGTNFYMQGFDWPTRYDISIINGTNTFPYMGWGGARIGSIKPVSFQFQQNSLYNYPSSLLELSKTYNPLGIIYPGQGIQIVNFPARTTSNVITFEKRNNRTFQDTINNRINERKYLGIQPYQQGRGTYEYVVREVIYNKTNGLVDYVEVPTTFGAEGVQPGRNNSFMGVALTDYWSNNLNLNNVESSSTTPEDTRYKIQGIKQTKTAHNAPMTFISDNQNNTYNPLPWNSLFSYIGTTTSSPSNKRSENTPILTEGITTMIISGAYPLYRTAHNSEYSGFSNPFFRWPGFGFSQYYITTEFWNPDFSDPATPEIDAINRLPSVAPNPPYRIKGGRIILYEGQRVNAGSYVYASVNMTNNVNMSQFYGPSAKDIVLNQGERDQLLGDTYSKWQSNQGGLIVVVVTEGRETPNPPSCAQPVGIVLEDVIGYGTPETANSQILYQKQTDASIEYQLVFDNETTNQIHGREILIKLFPMYPCLSVQGFPRQYFTLLFIFGFVGLPYTGNVEGNPADVGFPQILYPFYSKYRSLYTLHNSPYAYATVDDVNNPLVGNSIKEKQFGNDAYGPQSLIFT